MGGGALPKEFDAYVNVHPDNYTTLLDDLDKTLSSAEYTIVSEPVLQHVDLLLNPGIQKHPLESSIHF